MKFLQPDNASQIGNERDVCVVLHGLLDRVLPLAVGENRLLGIRMNPVGFLIRRVGERQPIGKSSDRTFPDEYFPFQCRTRLLFFVQPQSQGAGHVLTEIRTRCGQKN